MMPIGKRLLHIKNDAMQGGAHPVKARIHPRDYKELEAWIREQNRPHTTGLPQQALDINNLWGMKIVPDEKVTGLPVLEMKK